jgi:hypothetical protein
MQEDIQAYNCEILNFFVQCLFLKTSFMRFRLFKTIVGMQKKIKLNYIINFKNVL